MLQSRARISARHHVIGQGRQPCLISAQQLLDEREDAVIASQTRREDVELLTVDRS
jgi:hypothetical protein